VVLLRWATDLGLETAGIAFHVDLNNVIPAAGRRLLLRRPRSLASFGNSGSIFASWISMVLCPPLMRAVSNLAAYRDTDTSPH
jgi:hypothetical protein